MLSEAGIRNARIEFVRETTIGAAPADPAWKLFSDRITDFEFTPLLDYGQDRAVGDVDVIENTHGMFQGEGTVKYRLMQGLVDGSGNAVDAAADGILRNADNGLASTHTIVARTTFYTGGTDSNGYRLYTVAYGGHITRVTIPGDTGSPLGIEVELAYMPEIVESHRIDQPAAAITLQLVSDDAADTAVAITIEDDDAATSEQVTLNGTTAVTTTSSFASIDAVHVDSGTLLGDVTISDGSGTTYMVIRGKNSLSARAEEGIPLLGAGSHAAAIGNEPELFFGDGFERPSGTAVADRVISSSLQIENAVDATPRATTDRRDINIGNRTVTMQATTHGSAESHDKFVEHLKGTSNDLVWTLTNTIITVKGAVLTQPGSRRLQAGNAVAQMDNTFTAQGSPAITLAMV